MCREVQCKNYIEWEHSEEIWDHTKHYESIITCVSCTEVGESFNIDEYPNNCPHKVELLKYKKRQVAKNKRFVKKCEQENMWKKLNAVSE